jgi:hypothetical protein
MMKLLTLEAIFLCSAEAAILAGVSLIRRQKLAGNKNRCCFTLHPLGGTEHRKKNTQAVETNYSPH